MVSMSFPGPVCPYNDPSANARGSTTKFDRRRLSTI
jgi:hypothetical protein